MIILHNLFMWLTFSSNLIHGVESIKHFFVILPNYNFAERQITIVSSYDKSCDFFYLRQM